MRSVSLFVDGPLVTVQDLATHSEIGGAHAVFGCSHIAGDGIADGTEKTSLLNDVLDSDLSLGPE